MKMKARKRSNIPSIHSSMSISSTVIVNPRFSGHAVMKCLKLTNTRVGNGILPDLIFADSTPSMAVVFCDANVLNQGMIKKIEDIQKQFRNSFAIVVGLEDGALWSTFQTMIEFGNMRLFRVADEAEAAAFIISCHKEMSQKDRLAQQTTYFQNAKDGLVSAEQSRKITGETLARLGVLEEDALIIMDGFPTIHQMVNASKEVLAEYSPASKESIDKIAEFFEG